MYIYLNALEESCQSAIDVIQLMPNTKLHSEWRNIRDVLDFRLQCVVSGSLTYIIVCNSPLLDIVHEDVLFPVIELMGNV